MVRSPVVESKKVKRKDPWVISPFFSEDRYKKIINVINSFNKDMWTYDPSCERYIMANQYINRMSIYELDRARKEFEEDDLLWTYSLLSLYQDKDSHLFKHTDTNACTYTIDICLYTKDPWPIIVEGKEYSLNSNEALCFYGEDQEHWRPEFEDGNRVLMMFMHFADRDHVFFHASNKEVGV